jgi:hypothetical protein
MALKTYTSSADSVTSARNQAVASVVGYATDTSLAGSSITLDKAGFWAAGDEYRLKFDMTKTAAGTATPILVIRMGTLGTTADTAILTFTGAAGTAAVDSGVFDVVCTFRTVGSGTSAVLQGVFECRHSLAATGLISTGASGIAVIAATSSGFDSSTPTIIGASFNGGTSFAGTSTIVQASFKRVV